MATRRSKKNKGLTPLESKVTNIQIPPLLLQLTPILLICLALLIMLFHRTNLVSVERLRVATTDVLSPVLTAISAPFSAVADSLDTMTNIRDLKSENIRLKVENEKFKKWYEAGLKMQVENLSLRSLLNVKLEPEASFVTARIISDAGRSFVKTVLLPVGLKDGVQKGNAVMSGEGFIGRIMEVGERSSRVLLVTDLNSHIPVIIQNTRTRAILMGKNKDLMALERFPSDSGLTIGSRIVTSGDGGRLSPDIPIGTIVSIKEKTVWVKPLSDIDKLIYVQVVNSNNNIENIFK